MYRLWGKLIKNNKFIQDYVFEDDRPNLSGQAIFRQGLEAIAYALDLQCPMWLSDNETDFTRFGKVRFNHHHFIEKIDFDYLELEIIQQDSPNPTS